ncbi:hypothetical protein CSV77_03975 [Sporosarcina sp. P16b]|nr:hypothetical protein CSV77_03975 [Sporosarcina sp. P16b]
MAVDIKMEPTLVEETLPFWVRSFFVMVWHVEVHPDYRCVVKKTREQGRLFRKCEGIDNQTP